MELIMVDRTEGHGKFVTDFNRESPRLGKCHMVGVAGDLLTNQTRFARDEAQMCFAANSPGGADRKLAFVDL